MTNFLPGTEFIAHRGSSYLAPENTLAAFKLGWQETTTCELDVHSTLDGRLLVIHDASTQRTTGIDFQVAGHPLTELQQLDAGSWKGIEWKGKKLPSLEEAIAAIPAGKQLLIEIKAGPEIISELRRVIDASGKEEQLALQSFSHSACIEAKKTFPTIPVYLLIATNHNPSTGEWLPTIDEAIAQAQSADLNGINLNDTSLVDRAAVAKIHAASLKIHIWTVDEVTAAKRLLDLGVDGIITNRPGWLKAQLVPAH